MRFIIAFLLLTSVALAEQVPAIGTNPYENKYETYEQALEAAGKDPQRRLFCVFTASWCDPCHKFKSDVLFRKEMWDYLQKYTIVHFVDIDRESRVAKIYYDSKTWNGRVPMCFIYSHDSKRILGTLEGYQSTQQFIKWWTASVAKDKQRSPDIARPLEQDHPEMQQLAEWLCNTFSDKEVQQLVSYLEVFSSEVVHRIPMSEPTSYINVDTN